LPAPSPRHPSADADADAEPAPLRCLIVEDQLMLLQLLRTMLQAIDGIRICHTATSQAEALALCRQDPPDLLILDLALPDGSGLAVAEQLVAQKPEAQLIVLSGQASSFICPTALQPMVRGVVDKTSAFRQLQEAIGRCLPQRQTPLTPRQREIFRLIGQGLTNREIAERTGLALTTVETHRKAIAQKRGVSGAELVRQACLLGELGAEEGDELPSPTL
jgi:DNA-binding NarL/FixJ family response regulator